MVNPYNAGLFFVEKDMAQWLKRGALPMSLPAVWSDDRSSDLISDCKKPASLPF